MNIELLKNAVISRNPSVLFQACNCIFKDSKHLLLAVAKGQKIMQFEIWKICWSNYFEQEMVFISNSMPFFF
jgi:hypothetical protein